MKKGKRSILQLLAVLVLTVSMGITAYAGQWRSDANGWWYDNQDGSYPVSAWQQIDGRWYYFNESGYMHTGWLESGGRWYYLQPDGAMLTDALTPEGYYVNASGVWNTESATDIRRKYVQFLQSRPDRDYLYYAFIDLDGDGIEEMVYADLLAEKSTSKKHYPQIQGKSGCHVMGYDGKKVVLIDKLTLGSGDVEIKGSTDGVALLSEKRSVYLQIKGNAVASSKIWSKSSGSSYSIDGKSVTSAEYTKSLAEIRGMDTILFEEFVN